MRMSIVAAVVALSLAAANAATAAPARDGWPDTPAGGIGRRWVAAFCAGDSAMKAFQDKELSAEAKAKRTNEERRATYKKLHAQLGALTLGKVVNSKPEELTVKLLDADAKSHEFTFKVVVGPPAKLTSVAMKQSHFQHGGGGHGE